jgi:PAS domain S-box-containing protein
MNEDLRFSLNGRVENAFRPELRIPAGSLFNKLVQSDFIGICIRDGFGAFLDANDEFLRIIGYTREDLLAGLVRFAVTTPAEYHELYAAHIAEAVLHGTCTHYEKEYIRKDGSRIPVLCGYSRIQGSKDHYISFVQDLTAQRKAEAALKESEGQFHSLIDNLPLVLWTSDPKGVKTYCNPNFISYTGITSHEEMISSCFSLIHEDDREATEKAWSHALETGEICNAEYRLRRYDGVYRQQLARAVPIRDRSGQITQWLGSLTDVEDQKRTEETLLSIERNQAPGERVGPADIRSAPRQSRASSANNEVIRPTDEITSELNHPDIVGQSPALRKVLQDAEKVAPTDSAVLILGETGTGKELIARTIHRNSRRKGRHIVNVNCAALPASLVENELFGRERGAYTGALTREVGRFELADKSTIFLDEVGELPLELQAKLLRVLQEGEFERLGSSKTLRVDVRVIAATSRDLEKDVKEGKFREDLYYRLSVFPLRIPPLRERREDIAMLAWHFLRQIGYKMGRDVEAVQSSTMKALQDYHWPGNVRELRNVIERNLITHHGSVFAAEMPQIKGALPATGTTIEEIERAHIIRLLERSGWRVRGPAGAAEALGLKPTTLEARMKKLNIHRNP